MCLYIKEDGKKGKGRLRIKRKEIAELEDKPQLIAFSEHYRKINVHWTKIH